MTKKFKEIITPRIIINSAIAGGFVFFGAMSSGQININSIGLIIGASCLAFITQLKEDIEPKNKKGEKKFFQFI